MRFEYGNYIWFIFIIPVLIGLWILFHFRMRAAIRVFFNGNPENKLVCSQISGRKIILKKSLLFCAFLFLVFALLRPQYGVSVHNIKRKGIDIAFLIDVSNSMLTTDIKPNRLMRSKIEIKRCIEKYIKTDRVALVPFAGDAFIQCPLTFDYSAVFMLLDSLTPGIVSLQGTNIGAAIDKAISAFNEKEATNKTIIIVTDGEDHNPETIKTIETAIEKKIKIYAIGIGSPEGSPIMLKSGEFIKDSSGNIVTSRLGEELLKQISLSTGGAYYRLAAGSADKELALIFNEIMKLEKKEMETSQIAIYEERYKYFALTALLLLIIETFISTRKKSFKLFFNKNIFKIKTVK